MKAEEALALAKSYTKKSLTGAGALQGKDGFSPVVAESSDNTDEVYKLNITTKTGTIETPNLKGDKGEKGDTGLTGAKGEQGLRGEKGDSGEQGIQGIQGIKGDKGDDGYPFLIYKEYEDITAFNKDDFPEVGLMFMVKTGGTSGMPVYRYTGEEDEPYSYVTELATSEGIKGEKGDKGDTGEQGVAGKDGKDGITYTPKIGSVATVASAEQASASVSIDEERHVAEFNFAIPKGEKGDKGDTGNAGSGGSGGTSVTVDTAMSDTSENPVQNKVIKKYVDDKSVDISADTDNAIESKNDGIFVKDLSSVVDKISIAQRTVNNEAKYCSCFCKTNGNANWSANSSLLTVLAQTEDFTKIENGVTDDGAYFSLTEGTWNLEADTINESDNPVRFRWLDRDGNVLGSMGYVMSGVSSDVDVMSSAIVRVACGQTLDVAPIRIIDSGKVETGYSSIRITQITSKTVIDPLEYVNESQGIEDTPVGHIIAHMGTKAPKHYLVCDGAEYNIADYPYLAQHIKEEFGNYNYFGGDGTDTFAVPNLQGEFLRGSGTNSHKSQGDGSAVGKHQNATINHFDALAGSNLQVRHITDGGSEWDIARNPDVVTTTSANMKFVTFTGTAQTTTTDLLNGYTSRPTNTSVLYCIKYEPTYYMQNNYNADNVYSTDERIVGKWIDGKPIYQRTYELSTPLQIPEKTWSNLGIPLDFADKVISCHMYNTKEHYCGCTALCGINISSNYPQDTALIFNAVALNGIDIITLQYTKK